MDHDRNGNETVKKGRDGRDRENVRKHRDEVGISWREKRGMYHGEEDCRKMTIAALHSK